MSDMECPFCQQKLEYLAEDIYGNMYCPNCRDKNGFLYKASESIWQELTRTRKALDKAKNGLKELKDIIACPPDISYETCVSMYADGVLQEITALEQKDKL